MILWAFDEHDVETEPAWEGAPLRSWRWVVEAGVAYVGLTDQVRFGPDDEWGNAVEYFWVGVSRRWRFGMHHYYHDGPHHVLCLGPIYLNWSLGWCDVCMPPDEVDESGAVQEFVEQVLAAAMGGGAS